MQIFLMNQVRLVYLFEISKKPFFRLQSSHFLQSHEYNLSKIRR